MEEIPHRISAAFAASIGHWKALSRNGPLPSLSSYLDTANPEVQPWVGIVDGGSGTAQPVRLMGTGLVEYFGVDATGFDFVSLLSPQALPYLMTAHAEIPRRPCGAYFSGVCSTSAGRRVVLEGLGLPYQTRANHCVVWHLHPVSRLGFAEKGLNISEILDGAFIDLGSGVPQPMEGLS